MKTRPYTPRKGYQLLDDAFMKRVELTLQLVSIPRLCDIASVNYRLLESAIARYQNDDQVTMMVVAVNAIDRACRRVLKGETK